MDTVAEEVAVAGSVLAIARPVAWRAVAPPAGVAACALAADEPGFRPNVTVTVDDDADAALDQRVAALEASVAQLTVIATGERDGVQAVTAAHEHGGAAVVATQRYVPLPDAGAAVVTYTCSVDQYPQWVEAFRTMAEASGLRSAQRGGGQR